MTSNHNYNTPQQGASDWHVPLNENFDKLDTNVEIRDVESNRSAYEPKAGAKYLATDTGTVFVGDGQVWSKVGTIQNLPGDIHIQDSEPSNPGDGDLWIDTSSN